MIGLLAILITSTWIAVCVFLARKTREWLGIRPLGGLTSFLLFLVLFFAPFIDHIVGMWQFDRLCEERAVVWISPEASSVKKARRLDGTVTEIPGYWIAITSSKTQFVDVETGITFFSHEGLVTKGGRIAKMGLLGQLFSCSAKDLAHTYLKLDIKTLTGNGQKL